MQQHELIDLIATLEPGQVLVVEAEAGAGKTWSAMQALVKLPATSKVLVTAPTHVAVHELKSKLPDNVDAEVSFATSASMAGRYLHRNRDTGELENRFAPNCKANAVDLVIVDELSAVPACDIDRLLRSNCAVAALGDRAQLPPVLSPIASVWTDEWQRYVHRSFSYVQLEGQRRASGQLHELQQSMRDKVVPVLKPVDGCRVHYSTAEFEQDWLDAMRAAFEQGMPLDKLCLLAYRNETVDRLRAALRSQVFGTDSFAIGECVRVAGSAITSLPTGMLATVLSSTDGQTYCEGYMVPTATVLLRTAAGTELYVRCVHPSYEQQYKTLLEHCKADKNWDLFFKLEEQFTQLENASAMTVHKAQGRSIDYVWMHTLDIGSQQKLRYVAASRASKCLTTYWPSQEWAGATRKLLAGYQPSAPCKLL